MLISLRRRFSQSVSATLKDQICIMYVWYFPGVVRGHDGHASARVTERTTIIINHGRVKRDGRLPRSDPVFLDLLLHLTSVRRAGGRSMPDGKLGRGEEG